MKNTFTRLQPNPAAGMTPSDFTPPEAFTSGDTTEINHTSFATDDQSILVGVWECAPCREEIDAYPVHEMMTVLSGSVTLTDPDGGTSEIFTAGDTFFMPKGTRCIWEITETLRKYYMIAS
jgi:uncharacterized cupin superfamily protein